VKYRHSFHAGNFADIHKHVTLLTLLAALKRKEKGFAYFETHAGRGVYDLHGASESAAGVMTEGGLNAEELKNFAALLAQFRAGKHQQHAYPGSPLIAAHELRAQDRGVLAEILPSEARSLEREIEPYANCRVEIDDGFEKLRAWLPPRERRALTLIDPPYEENRQDFQRVISTIVAALQRFATGVYAAWYPIKQDREVRAWHDSFARAISAETLVSELWLYPRDSKVALNGSGLLIVNPPYQLAERMQIWLPELQSRLDVGHPGGSSVRMLAQSATER
jgi:23S rRNA (adenine2030-N6)-methyltransferase